MTNDKQSDVVTRTSSEKEPSITFSLQNWLTLCDVIKGADGSLTRPAPPAGFCPLLPVALAPLKRRRAAELLQGARNKTKVFLSQAANRGLNLTFCGNVQRFLAAEGGMTTGRFLIVSLKALPSDSLILA